MLPSTVLNALGRSIETPERKSFWSKLLCIWSKTCGIAQSVVCSSWTLMTYCCNNIFIHTFGFYIFTIVVYKKRIYLSIQRILQSQHFWFHLTFFQEPICLNHHNILTQSNNNKSNISLLLLKSSFTPSLLISYIKLSVSEINNFDLLSYLFLMQS